jgi:hypothetical protein
VIIVFQPKQVFVDVTTPQCLFVVASDTNVETIGGIDAWVVQEQGDLGWIWALEGEGVWHFTVQDEDGGPSGVYRVGLQQSNHRWAVSVRDMRNPEVPWEFLLPEYDASYSSTVGQRRGVHNMPSLTIWDHITNDAV